MKSSVFFSLAAVGIALTAASACRSENPAATPSKLVLQGQTVYRTQCTACHNSNPKQPGSIGPEVWESSLELIQARVQSASYPTGYTPKRSTRVMAPLPHIRSDEIQALHSYLNTKDSN